MRWLNKFTMICVGMALLFLAGCFSSSEIVTPVNVVAQIPPRDYWPTEDWQRRTIVTPDGSVLFEDLSKKTDRKLPFVNSLVVVYRGYIVYEGYFNGYQSEDLQLQQSVAKSITSTLVGIALDQGDIPSLDLTLGEVLPEYFENEQTTISPEISIRDVLMMRSGISYDGIDIKTESESPEAYDAYLDTRLQEHLIDSILPIPQAYEPGIAWQYSTSDIQLLSEMFQKLVGQSLSDYADRYLFTPLGINKYIWRHDGNGVTVGGALLWLRPSDMAKFGYLFLNEGFWDGYQIVTEEWVQASTEPQGKAIDMDTHSIVPINYYGYLWWLWEPGSFGMPNWAYQAVGYGGQYIVIVPDIDTVIVATSNALVDEKESDKQQGALAEFIYQRVIRELASLKEPLQLKDN